MVALSPFDLLSFLLLLSFSLALTRNCDPTTRAVVVITRHGDRTPIKTFRKSESEWELGEGQLTWKGMTEQYEMGKEYRMRYIKQCKLLDLEYHPDKVYARSTSKDRTLMSAQSFLLGLYPPGVVSSTLPSNLQPIPIHASHPKHDSILYAYKTCNALKQMREEIRQSQQWKEMEEKHQPLLNNLTVMLGDPISLTTISSVYTLFKQELRHGKPTYATPELLEQLKEIHTWLLYNHKFPTQKMGKLGAGDLVHEIYSIFEEHVSGKDNAPVFTLFSAHDGTLLALFSALDIRNYSIPEFSSHVTFELHFAEGEWFVRVYYNNKILQIPSCMKDPAICMWHDFERLGKELVNGEHWYSACGIKLPGCHTQKPETRRELKVEHKIKNIHLEDNKPHVPPAQNSLTDWLFPSFCFILGASFMFVINSFRVTTQKTKNN